MISEGQVIQKSKMPATADSLQADFAALGVESGDDPFGSFLVERFGVGQWRSCSRHHCPSARFGFHWHSRDASLLNRLIRTKSVEKAACTGIMVEYNPCDDASLPSGFDSHS